MQSDWLPLDIWLWTANQSALFQPCVVIAALKKNFFYKKKWAIPGLLKVRERGNRKENCKITKMLLDVVTFSWKIILNRIKRRSVENVDKVI